MADDIYDYFGGGGTREVEPIEDESGEFDAKLGQENKNETTEAAQSQTTPDADPASDDIFAAFAGNNTSAPAEKTKPQNTRSSESAPSKSAPFSRPLQSRPPEANLLQPNPYRIVLSNRVARLHQTAAKLVRSVHRRLLQQKPSQRKAVVAGTSSPTCSVWQATSLLLIKPLNRPRK